MKLKIAPCKICNRSADFYLQRLIYITCGASRLFECTASRIIPEDARGGTPMQMWIYTPDKQIVTDLYLERDTEYGLTYSLISNWNNWAMI
jgi:hypothetical protein